MTVDEECCSHCAENGAELDSPMVYYKYIPKTSRVRRESRASQASFSLRTLISNRVGLLDGPRHDE